MTSQTVYQYAIKLLTLRDYSRFKLANKLTSKGYSDLEVNEVINQLLSLNYLREDNYIRAKVKQLLLKGYSNNYIKRACDQEQLNISEEDIDNLRSEFHLSSDEIIIELINKKLRNKKIPQTYIEKQKLKSKLFFFLQSKGHESQLALKLIDQKLQ